MTQVGVAKYVNSVWTNGFANRFAYRSLCVNATLGTRLLNRNRRILHADYAFPVFYARMTRKTTALYTHQLYINFTSCCQVLSKSGHCIFRGSTDECHITSAVFGDNMLVSLRASDHKTTEEDWLCQTRKRMRKTCSSYVDVLYLFSLLSSSRLIVRADAASKAALNSISCCDT